MGNILNDVMGTTSSAKQQYRYNKALQRDAQEFAKWQMGNAHQLEAEDLEKAGINRVLTAGGSGASAGVSANSTGSGTSAGIDPISMASAIVEMINSTKQTNNEIKNTTKTTNATVKKLDAETRNIDQNTNINEPDTEVAKALKWWNSTWVGKATNVAGDIIGKISPFTAQAVQYQGAKRIAKSMGKDSTEVTNHYNKKGDLIGSTTKTKKH